MHTHTTHTHTYIFTTVFFLVLKSDWLRGVRYSSDNKTPTVSLFVIVSLRLQYFSQQVTWQTLKGAVCRILTLLKHKNTIICLQIFKKHAKLTCLSEKQCYSQYFSFENVHSGPECLYMFWFVKPAHCQFTQLYFGIPGCQLAGNTAYFISVIVMCTHSCWWR